MTKKVVIKLQIHEEKEKQKAMKAVSSLSGIESLAMDMKEKKLTVVGEIDAVQVASKLRKFWHAEILTVGPAKEPEKKDDKKEEEKKKEDEKKKEEEKKKKEMEELIKSMYKNCNPHYPPYPRFYSVEENPNSCVIC